MKFKVGQKWKTRGGKISIITKVCDTDTYVAEATAESGQTWGILWDGRLFEGCDDCEDLIELVQEGFRTPPSKTYSLYCMGSYGWVCYATNMSKSQINDAVMEVYYNCMSVTDMDKHVLVIEDGTGNIARINTQTIYSI